MMDWKRIVRKPQVIAILVVLLVFLALAGYYFWKKSQYVLYENRAQGVQFQYPKGWEIKEMRGGAVVSIIAPQEGELDLFRENVSLTIEQLSGRQMLLREYAAMSIRQLQSVFKNDIKLLTSEETFLAGRQAHKIVYDVEAKYLLRIKHVFLFKNENVYMLTYTAEQDIYEEYHSYFKTIAGSFQVD